jgi:hypothetical protein
VTLVSGGNIPEMDCRIKAQTATKSRQQAWALGSSWQWHGA